MLFRSDYRRQTRIPARLATELARATSLAQGIWAEARAKDAPADFLPVLNDILMLKREEAAALADGGDLYDALLDDYEPGATQAQIAALFDAMRPRLVALRENVLGAEFQPAPLSGHFPQETQLRLARACTLLLQPWMA